MPDIGYAVGTEDSNGNFVEHGRFNNKTSSKADPVLLEHADSGNTAELGSDRLEVTGANLRLDTGRAIEDGSGTPRVAVSSVQTLVNDNSGDTAVRASNGVETGLRAYSGQPFLVRDQEGRFTAVKYETSSSAPGTLSLSNAKIEADASGIGRASGNARTAIDAQGSSGANLSQIIEFSADSDGDGNFGYARLFYDDRINELRVDINGTVKTIA